MTHTGFGWIGSGLLAGVLSIAAVRGLSAGPQEPTRTVNDAVYSAPQAERGQKTFEAKCGVCHEPGRFKEATFLDGWKGEPLSALFETIGTTMPADNPGGLQPQEYGDVIAFMLRLNGYPAGAAELAGAKAAMAVIRIEPLKPR